MGRDHFYGGGECDQQTCPHKDSYTVNCGTYECVRLPGERDCADVIKVMDREMGEIVLDYLGGSV